MIVDGVVKQDEALKSALTKSLQQGLPDIEVSPNTGKLLALLVSMSRAKRVLEVGTLGGYSAIWMGRSLPAGGYLMTIEADPAHADVARRNIDAAGLSGSIEVFEGTAEVVMPRLIGDAVEPFDLIFIDAEKDNIDAYFKWSIELSRPSSIIVIDNVVRGGGILYPEVADGGTRGVLRLYDFIEQDTRIDATVLQTVGSKGHDGLLVGIVRG